MNAFKTLFVESNIRVVTSCKEKKSSKFKFSILSMTKFVI